MMQITAFARCGWCHALKLPQFYRGKRVARCGCDGEYRTPVEIRRDAVLDRYGNDPDAYTPAVLAELAGDGLFDLTTAFCPAGKLSMEETKAREAAQAIEAQRAATENTDAVREGAV